MNDQKWTTSRTLASKTPRAAGLALQEMARMRPGEQRSSDPYNTSGSFDRKKHWERVGKR